MIFALFAVGSLAFWAFVTVAIIVALCFLESENISGASWTTLLALAVIVLLSPVKAAIALAVANPLIVLGAVLLYVLIGTIYSFLKWDRFLSKIRCEYEYRKFRWLSERGISGDAVPDDQKVEWTVNLKRCCMDNTLSERVYKLATNKINYINYKALIVSWIVWWPISAFWMLINDPIRKIAEEIVFRFRKVYSWIANRHRSSMQNEIELDEQIVDETRFRKDRNSR